MDVTFQSDGETLSSKNLDFRMENIVYIELLRRYKKDNVDVYFHKDGYEVDFVVVEKTSVLEMIQVTCKMDSTKTRTRELGVLAKAYAKFRCKNLTLISLNERGTKIYNRIPIKMVAIVN